MNEAGGTIARTVGTGTTTIGLPFTNNGTVDVDTGTLRLTSTFSNYNSGTKTLTGGAYHLASTFKFNNADINTNQAEIVLNGPAAQIVNSSNVDALADLSLNDVGAKFTVAGGKLFSTSAAYTNEGITHVNGATFTAGAFVNGAAGILSGTGTVAIAGVGQVLTNEGIVAPGPVDGNGAGVLSITGDYTQDALGTLEIELGGLVAGSTFDQLVINGAAALAGSLDVSIVDGFAPDFGDVFTILDAASLSGSFAGLAEGTTLTADGVEFDISYLTGGGTEVELTVSGFTLRADFDLDVAVDGTDLSIWQAGFGNGTSHAEGDADDDSNVDGGDFLAWQRQFTGSPTPLVASSTGVPEPSTLLLGGMACCGLLLRKNRKQGV